MLKSDPKLSELFTVAPQVIYRRNKNSRNTLMNSHNKGIVSKGCEPCTDKRCLCCKHVQTGVQLESTSSHFIFQILGKFACKSSKCNLLYSKRSINIFFNLQKPWKKQYFHITIFFLNFLLPVSSFMVLKLHFLLICSDFL